MAHRDGKKELLLDDQGILLDDDEPVRQRGGRQRDVTFDDSHPFTDEPTLNLSEFEDSIKEEIDYGDGGQSEEEFGEGGVDYRAGFEPAAFKRVRGGSQTQDSLAEFEAIEQNLLQDGSHGSALFERSRENSGGERSRDEISFQSNEFENSAADQYEQYLSEQEHGGSGNEFSLGGEDAEHHSRGLDDFAAKYGSQSARSYDGQYANEGDVGEDVSRLVGEESFPRNSFLDSSLLNDTVIPINASDSTFEKTPQPTFDHSKNSTPSPSNRRVSDIQSSGDHLVPPSKTPLTSTPNSPDSRRPDISVQSVRDEDSDSRTPVRRPDSDLSYSGFHERVSEIAKRDAAILRPRFTTYGAEPKVSPPKSQRTPPTESPKKASNVSFKIDRSSGRILGVSQSTPQSDPSKNTSLRERRRRNRMSRGDSGSKSRHRTETETSVSDLDLDGSGRSSISRSELSQRLKDEVKSKTETSEQLRELQEEYDNLLAKYALAEVTIDHLRLGAKVNLYSDPPKPAPAFVGSIPQPHKIQMVDIPRSQRAQLDRTGEQAVTATLSPPQPSHSRLTQTAMSAGNGPDPFVGEGEEDPTLTATASGESLKVALLLQAASLEDQVDSFEALLDLNQLNLAEQDEVLSRLQAENDRLNQDYLDARDEHDRMRRAGDTKGEFDEDKSVAGKLHQLGMRLEDLGERVENNRTNPSPDTTQQDTGTSLRESVATEPMESLHTQMDLPLEGELEEGRGRMEEEFGRLMDRYRQLKGMPRTPDRDREIQDLMQQLQELRRDAPLSLDLPPELDDSLSQVSSPQLEETDLPEQERSRLPSRLLGHTPGQPSHQDTSHDQSSLHFSPDSPDRKGNQWQSRRDQESEDDTPPAVRPKDRRNASHSRAPKSQNKDSCMETTCTSSQIFSEQNLQQSCSVVDCTSSISLPHGEKHTTTEHSMEPTLPAEDATTDHNVCQSQQGKLSEGKSGDESKRETKIKSDCDFDFDASSLQNCKEGTTEEKFGSSCDSRLLTGKDEGGRQKEGKEAIKGTEFVARNGEKREEKVFVRNLEQTEKTDIVRNVEKDEETDIVRSLEKDEKLRHSEKEREPDIIKTAEKDEDIVRNAGISSQADKDIVKFVQECLEEPSSLYDQSASVQPATSDIGSSNNADLIDGPRHESDVTALPRAQRDLSEFHDINNESMPMVSLLLDSSPNSSNADGGKKHRQMRTKPRSKGGEEDTTESVGKRKTAEDFVCKKTNDEKDNLMCTPKTSRSDYSHDVSVVHEEPQDHDVPLPDNVPNRVTESRRSSTMFQPCRQISSHLPKPILKAQTLEYSQNMDRCEHCGQPLQSQPSTHVGSTSSVADSGRSSPTHRPVAKATLNQPQQEAEIDSGFIGSESSRQSQMTTPLVPKREPRATRERHRSPVTTQVSQKPSRPSSGHRSTPKHRPAPLQQVSDSDSLEERPTTVREVQPARPSGKKNPEMTTSQRRRPPSTRSRSSNTSHKRHYSSSEDDISRRSVASSRGSSRDEAIQGLKREIENMREELDDRLRRAQNRDRPGKSGLPSTPREPVRAYPTEGSYLEDEDDRIEHSRSGSLKGPYTGKDYTPYATRRRAPFTETSPMDTRDLRSSHSRTRTPSPVGSERRSTRRTRDRSTSPLDTRPKELGRSDLGYTPRRTGSYVRTTGPCPLCGGSGVHTHGEYVHPPPEPVEYRYVPVNSTAPVSPVVHYVPASPRYVPTTPRTLQYEEVGPSPGVVYSPYPSPVVYVSPRRGRVRYYQRKYSITETEEEEGTDDELRLSHLHLGSSLERAERAAREMKRRSRKMANTLDTSLSRSKAKLSAIDWY
ncbi:uncharacterized protein LOC144878833 isoform X3 [Branchiostoma floridae x Branchiostoma japonicum]